MKLLKLFLMMLGAGMGVGLGWAIGVLLVDKVTSTLSRCYGRRKGGWR